MIAVRSAGGLETSTLSGDVNCEIHVHGELGTHVVFGKTGETLLSAMHRHGIAIGSVCGGNMICGTCHVWLNEEAGSDFLPPPPEEMELLLLSNVFEPRRSRLACQMRIPRGIHGLCLEAAPDE